MEDYPIKRLRVKMWSMRSNIRAVYCGDVGVDTRVETKMHCIKRLGQALPARDFDRQVAESQSRIAVLNRYTALGIPVTELVV